MNSAVLCEALYPTAYTGTMWPRVGFARKLLWRWLGVRCYQRMPEKDFVNGTFWPLGAYTMIGVKRLEALRESLEETAGLPGVNVECGVWRGGALIWMSLLSKKQVWGFDTFDGMQRTGPEDAKDTLHRQPELRVSRNEVRDNLNRFGADAVLVQGLVQNTLPRFRVPIAVLRIDVDHYEAVLACFENLWPLVVRGGHVHIDDYGTIEGCRKATDKFRPWANPIERRIDTESLLWVKR